MDPHHYEVLTSSTRLSFKLTRWSLQIHPFCSIPCVISSSSCLLLISSYSSRYFFFFFFSFLHRIRASWNIIKQSVSCSRLSSSSSLRNNVFIFEVYIVWRARLSFSACLCLCSHLTSQLPWSKRLSFARFPTVHSVVSLLQQTLTLIQLRDITSIPWFHPRQVLTACIPNY